MCASSRLIIHVSVKRMRNFFLMYHITAIGIIFHDYYFDRHTVNAAITNGTVVPTKSDSDTLFYLGLLSKTLTFTLHLS